MSMAPPPTDQLKRVLIAHFLLLRLAAAVPAVIVFGDSSVDSGNNNFVATVARSNFPPYGRDFNGGEPTGRFSNGRLATDFISEALGLPSSVPAYLDPHVSIDQLARGVCFASAATGFDNATANVLSVITLSQQVEYYKEYKERLRKLKGDAGVAEIISGALHIVSLGTNDFIESYFSSPSAMARMPLPEYQGYLVGLAEAFVHEIYALGARKLDITGLPPIGCLPVERLTNVDHPGDCNEEFNDAARGFNARLRTLADKLGADLPGMKVAFADVYEKLTAIVNHPSAYGFENAYSGCCGTGFFETGIFCTPNLVCDDANKFVFFDSIHPSERTYKILADYVLDTTLKPIL